MTKVKEAMNEGYCDTTSNIVSLFSFTTGSFLRISQNLNLIGVMGRFKVYMAINGSYIELHADSMH
jgi:hypothetical protein